MVTLGTKANPLIRSAKMYGSTLLIAAAAIVGTGVAIHDSTPHPVEPTRIQESANLPGGQAMVKDANFIRTHSGYNETCTDETWIVPAQYETVADFLSEHPNAKPDRARIVTPSERGACSANANLGPYELSTYYQKTTAQTQEPEA